MKDLLRLIASCLSVKDYCAFSHVFPGTVYEPGQRLNVSFVTPRRVVVRRVYASYPMDSLILTDRERSEHWRDLSLYFTKQSDSLVLPPNITTLATNYLGVIPEGVIKLIHMHFFLAVPSRQLRLCSTLRVLRVSTALHILYSDHVARKCQDQNVEKTWAILPPGIEEIEISVERVASFPPNLRKAMLSFYVERFTGDYVMHPIPSGPTELILYDPFEIGEGCLQEGIVSLRLVHTFRPVISLISSLPSSLKRLSLKYELDPWKTRITIETFLAAVLPDIPAGLEEIALDGPFDMELTRPCELMGKKFIFNGKIT